MDKTLIKDLIPPILIKIFQKRRIKYGWSGDYNSWKEAQKASKGYDSDVILERVKNALLKVKKGEAVYERDSVLFDEIHYSWPVLAGLLMAACENGNRLSVLDFGGSLGSSYFQNKIFLSVVKDLRWSVVEQKHFVECGKNHFEDNTLSFYESIESCMANEHPDVVILSSVLSYLEEPYEILESVIQTKIAYIIVDRTPFLLNAGRDRLTIQKVPPSIYAASYPAWFFDKKKFLGFLMGRYKLVAEFDALGGYIYIGLKKIALDRGMIFRKI